MFTVSGTNYNPKYNAVAYPIIRQFKSFNEADRYMRFLTETRQIGISITIPGMELARNSYWALEHQKVID